MLRLDNLNQNQVLTITAKGTLTQQDYEDVMPSLESILEQHSKLRFYIKLEDCSGIRPGALWEDLKFDMKHRSKFGRTAVVGDKKWEEWGTKLAQWIVKDEVKFFHADQRDEAWEWVNH
ncbi:MAG: STAS/SEC14 domain-containing protein [Gammaproteobacteria bacterium]|nr:STAS/SEC14 domain-containing protein [Gammaproteobacteria bacterium]